MNKQTSKKAPKTLYHYTTARGLMGILDQKKIWATHINFLNDKKEFIDALNEFKKQTENLRPKVRTPTVTVPPHGSMTENSPTKIYDDVLEFLQIMETVVYVTAFSEKPDQLSQWRGYCANGAGFSIGFNLAKLKELLKRAPGTDILLKKCIYDPRIKKAKMELIIKAAESTNLRDRHFDTLVSKMMMIAPFFKDESFKEEREWRLAFIPGGENLFREGDTLIIPYVEFDLKDENGKLPIDNIVIGPTLNMKESHASLEMVLNKHKISATIEESNIPYRPGL